ncbi:hypothetical protein B9Z19DRAFT_1126497 [Tuber borchii]|uniref:Major facilitator superfamily domain-containing protein n=1 Tax=Tuber borchii TaxID=42251 RepID=A0A2T6ZSW9_TUBBO|nr:hypothetical protein B9Z19DRAFT_1126497 [Tuber borchii]
MGDLSKIPSLEKLPSKPSELLVPGLALELTPLPLPILPDPAAPPTDIPTPPFIFVEGGAAHTPTAGLPPAPLSRETVLQRDETARIFGPSPLSPQLSQTQPSGLGPTQEPEQQVHLQRNGHRLLASGRPPRGKHSNSWPSNVKRDASTVDPSETGHSSLTECINSVTNITRDPEIEIAGQRPRPARAFEEMGVEIGIDGTTWGASKREAPWGRSLLPLDGASLAILEESMRAFQIPTTILSPTNMGKRRWLTSPLDHLECWDICEFRGPPERVALEYSRISRASGEAIASANYGDLCYSGDPSKSHPVANRSGNDGNLGFYRSQSTNSRQHDIREPSTPFIVRESHKPTNDKAANRATYGFSILPKIAISQMDGSVESREQSARAPNLNLNPREEQSVGIGQDFGSFRFQYQPASENTIRMIEEGLARGGKSRVHRIKDTLRTRIKNLVRQIVPRLDLRSRKGRGHVKKGVQTILREDYAEDSGVREAVAVTRSWKNVDLLTTYTLLFALSTFFHLGSPLPLMLLNAVAEDLSKPRKMVMMSSISLLEYELVWAGLIIADMVGVFICAFGGLMRVGYSGFNWVDLVLGLVIFSFSKSGVLIVIYVMIADMSDLRWRAICSWGMDWGIGISVWSVPLIEEIIGSIATPSTGRLYLYIGMPLAVVTILTTYIFLEKAKSGGFIPKVPVAHLSKPKWWSIVGIARNLLHTAERLDIIGMSLWTFGSGLLLSGSLISSEFWELHLNALVERAMSRKLARDAGLTRGGISTKNGRGACFPELTASGRDARRAMELLLWENPRNLEFEGPNQPLIRTRLIRSRSIGLGGLIGFLVNFVLKISIYSEGDPIRLPPARWEGVRLYARIFPQNIAITSQVFASLAAAIVIRSSQKPKRLVVTGQVIILIGVVATCFIWEPTIHELYGIAPQILLGIGAGFVWIALLIRVQSGCSQHTDVAMATALLVTFNKLGDVAGGIVKRIVKTSIIKQLAHRELAQVDDSIYGGWVALLAVAVSVAAFNIFLAAFGLEETVIGEMKQKVSGIIFGVGDPPPGGGNDTEDSNSTTASDSGQRHQRPYNLAVGEVSAPSSDPGGRQSSRSERGKELPCRGIRGLVSYSSWERAQGRDFATRGRDRNDVKPGSKTVFGEGSRTPKLGLDTDSEPSIFIDDGIQLDEEAQSGVSGAMQIVDGGYFSYNGFKLVRKLGKPSFNPSTRSRDSGARSKFSSSRSREGPWIEEELTKLQCDMESPTSTYFASTSHIISEAERLRRKNTYILPRELSPIDESVSGSLSSPSNASAESHAFSESVADSGKSSSSHCSPKLYIHSNISQLNVARGGS